MSPRLTTGGRGQPRWEGSALVLPLLCWPSGGLWAVQSLEEVERTTFLFLTPTKSYRGFLVTLALQHSRNSSVTDSSVSTATDEAVACG